MDKKNRFGGKGRQGVISALINSSRDVNPAPPATSPPKKVRNAAAISAQRGRRILRSADRADVRDSVNEAIGSKLGLRHLNRRIG